MKKFISQISLFFTFSLLAYLLLLFFWGSLASNKLKPNLNYKIGSYGHLFTRLKEVKHITDIDILFLGSSHTYRGYDTRIFKKNGYNSFNLGSSAQTPIETLLLVKRYLNHLKPKVAILDVYPKTFNLDGVESSIDIISNDENDIYSLEMAFKINHIKTYNTLLYGSIRDFLNLNDTFKEPKTKGKDVYIPGGFVQKRIQYNKVDALPKTEIKIKKNQLKAFEEILEYLKDKNIEVILVYTPISSELYSSFSNNAYFDSLMSSYADYYNFNELITLNDTLSFFDDNHLNQNGVKIFDSKLIKTLEKDRLINKKEKVSYE